MNILITNDDGIDSLGIYALAKQFVNEGNIIVSAPDRQRSASSHSITMHMPITAKEVNFFDLDCKSFAVSGTPVDCVKLAYERLAGCNIDFVISGINDGENLGTDVLYSGTVSAAIEGALLDIPSMAVSLLYSKNEREYGTAARYAYIIYKKLVSETYIPGMVLNINVPSCKPDEIKGIAATSLGIRKYTNSYEERMDTQGNPYYWLAGDIVKNENGSTTDIFAVDNKYVSVTPMHYELTHYKYIDVINTWKYDI
jgi:5'-nucleotidase